MKKSFIVKVYAVVLPALLISTSPLQPVEATNKKITVEKEKLDFRKEPAKYLGEIYNDYHFYKTDEGIRKAENALKIIDKIYEKNPETELSDPALRWKKAYQIKSTLHTLLGMLYFRKSLDVATEIKRKESEYLKKVLKEKKKLTDEDIKKLAEMAEEQNRIMEIETKKYADLAAEHFKKAIEVYPENPYPHYQLAKFYLTAGEKKLAEKELLETAKIFLKWKDYKSFESLIDFVKQAGADTAFIKRLEKLRNNNG
jgi:tetratricopeptide (TPR) repeat protein